MTEETTEDIGKKLVNLEDLKAVIDDQTTELLDYANGLFRNVIKRGEGYISEELTCDQWIEKGNGIFRAELTVTFKDSDYGPSHDVEHSIEASGILINIRLNALTSQVFITNQGIFKRSFTSGTDEPSSEWIVIKPPKEVMRLSAFSESVKNYIDSGRLYTIEQRYESLTIGNGYVALELPSQLQGTNIKIVSSSIKSWTNSSKKTAFNVTNNYLIGTSGDVIEGLVVQWIYTIV